MGLRCMQTERNSTGSLLQQATRSLRATTMKQRPVPTAEEKRALRAQRRVMRREELIKAKEEEEQLAKAREEKEQQQAMNMSLEIPPLQRKRKHSIEELAELLDVPSPQDSDNDSVHSIEEVAEILGVSLPTAAAAERQAKRRKVLAESVAEPRTPPVEVVSMDDQAYDSDATIVLDDSEDEREPDPLTDREVRKARAYNALTLDTLIKDEMGRWNYSLIHGKDCMKSPNGIPSEGLEYEEEGVADDESSEDEDDNLGNHTLEQYWDLIVDDLILMPNNKLALDVFYDKVYSIKKMEEKIVHATPEEFAVLMAMARFYSYYHPGATMWYGYRKTRMDHWDLIVDRYNSRKTARIQAGNHQGGPIASPPKRVPFPHKRQATATELKQSSASKKPRLSDDMAYLGIKASLQRHSNCGIRFSNDSIKLVDMPSDLHEEEEEVFMWL